jgi:hypothetical protein
LNWPEMPERRPALGALSLIGQSLRLLGANFYFLFPIAFVPALALAALAFVTGTAAPPAAEPDPFANGAAAGWRFASILLDVIVGFIVTGVMCLAAIDALIGKRHTIGEYFGQTLRHLAPIVLLGALLYLLVVVGLALFVLPGLYIMARFWPWIAAIVFENAGWSGLTRGQELTEGYRWPLAGALALFLILVVVVAIFLAPFIAVGVTAGPLVLLPIEAAFTAIFYALVAVFTALVYARLRQIKEGMTTADIAATIE